MTAPVHLNDLVDEINLLREDATCYLNRHTGEIYTVSAEEASMLDLIEDPDVVSDDEREDLEKVFEVTNSHDFLALPGRKELDEAMSVDAFCKFLDDKKQCQTLKKALEDKPIEDALNEMDLMQDWYSFKDETMARITREWLEEKNIPYTEED